MNTFEPDITLFYCGSREGRREEEIEDWEYCLFKREIGKEDIPEETHENGSIIPGRIFSKLKIPLGRNLANPKNIGEAYQSRYISNDEQSAKRDTQSGNLVFK